MNILLLQPYSGQHAPNFFARLSSKLPINPNLTLQQLAGIIPPDHDVTAKDENRGDTINYDTHYDVVCISSNTAAATRAYEIADAFRQHQTPVILGGYHPSALPEEAKQHADAVITGEAELSLPQALQDLLHGTLQPFYHHEPIDPTHIPFARRDVIDYLLPTAALEATRGCPINCEFCFVRNVKGSPYRKRPIDHVLGEIQSIKHKHLMFYDASLTMDPTYTKSLFKAMADLNRHFTCYGNLNVLGKDDDLLRIASEAGCLGWCIGFETISQTTLDSIGKTTNKVKDFVAAVKKIRDHNMNVTGSFIFGFDDHTRQSFQETSAMIDVLDISLACINILTPYPGTRLFERFRQDGRITTYDWSHYTGMEPVFQPHHMTQQELLEGAYEVLDHFYSVAPTMRRIQGTMKFGVHPFIESISGNLVYLSRRFDHSLSKA
jgi:radical SAM superfamily enzyme YgiQ (UPF0313 family)